ncbi:hypothetical protein K458DRAFT_81967 [Lentithecium fluviatile CBS 122367]|uniref:Uncharacterized protein n=1 Tax=Lentithecium fluviatile CBS 122367 TaxID=1168545 RepID=A0A6G1ITG7_9PLEO|nr:hypothetical protein K458DRAFT_81967 [Lentithecium fluviatile CBS 122367]
MAVACFAYTSLLFFFYHIVFVVEHVMIPCPSSAFVVRVLTSHFSCCLLPASVLTVDGNNRRNLSRAQFTNAIQPLPLLLWLTHCKLGQAALCKIPERSENILGHRTPWLSCPSPLPPLAPSPEFRLVLFPSPPGQLRPHGPTRKHRARRYQQPA